MLDIKIYDEWLENSITTVDKRNGRDCTKIRKSEHLKRFKDLVNEEVIKEETNKRGVKLFTATRKVMTCTIRKLQVKLFAKYKMNVSTGTIFKLKPFFISFPTEKEKILCMCKLRLNLRMKFDCIMEHTKNQNGKVFISMSNFYMDNCTCNKSEVGY